MDGRWAQTGTDHHGLVSALLVTNTTGHSSTPADQPTPTVATGESHMPDLPEMIAGKPAPEQLDGALWVSAFPYALPLDRRAVGEAGRSADHDHRLDAWRWSRSGSAVAPT